MKDPEPRTYTSFSNTLSAVHRCRFLAKTTLTATLLLTSLNVLAQDGSALSTSLESNLSVTWLTLGLCLAGALLVAFVCALSESVLLNMSPTYLTQLEKSQPGQARRLQKLRGDHFQRSQIALLTLNTLALITGASVAAAFSMDQTHHLGLSVMAAVLTALFLFLAGILPKTLGMVHWRRLALPIAQFVGILNSVLLPVVLVAEWFSKIITRGHEGKAFNRDEFIAMAHMGTQAGQINEHESRIIRNLFHFGSIRTQDIMTPRTVVSALPESMPIEHALQFRMNAPFSRIPVFGDDLDAVTGFVLREDMLVAQTRGTGHRPIAELRREIIAVAASTSLSTLLELFVNQRQQIAIVIGEYGETKGLVTMEDVIETLLGIEILDEGDKVEDMQALARKLWRKRAESLGFEPAQTSRPDPYMVVSPKPVQKRDKRLELANART